MSKILGSRIKLFRTKENMTREELATQLEISIHTLIKYEQGQREPNFETLNKIAKALNVPLSRLLESSDSVDIDSLQSKTFDAIFKDHSVSTSTNNELFSHNLKMNSLYDNYFHDLFFWKTKKMNPHEFFNFILSISPFAEVQFLSKEDIEELSSIFYRLLQLKCTERNYLSTIEDSDEFAKVSFLKSENVSQKYSIHTFYDK